MRSERPVMVDPRQPRVGQAITGLVLGIGFVLGRPEVLPVVAVVLAGSSALLLGAVFGCTSSTIVMPVLQQLNVREPLRVVLLLESALGDVIGVLAVSSLLHGPATGAKLDIAARRTVGSRSSRMPNNACSTAGSRASRSRRQ